MMNFRVSIPSVECPGCSRTKYLPHQSQSGTVQHLVNPPKDAWPITFVCTTCGRASVHYWPPDDSGGQSGSLPDLWRVGCVCDRENCGKHHDIYTTYNSDSPEAVVRQRLIRFAVHIGCSGHDFLLKEETIRTMERFVVE